MRWALAGAAVLLVGCGSRGPIASHAARLGISTRPSPLIVGSVRIEATSLSLTGKPKDRRVKVTARFPSRPGDRWELFLSADGDPMGATGSSVETDTGGPLSTTTYFHGGKGSQDRVMGRLMRYVLADEVVVFRNVPVVRKNGNGFQVRVDRPQTVAALSGVTVTLVPPDEEAGGVYEDRNPILDLSYLIEPDGDEVNLPGSPVAAARDRVQLDLYDAKGARRGTSSFETGHQPQVTVGSLRIPTGEKEVLRKGHTLHIDYPSKKTGILKELRILVRHRVDVELIPFDLIPATPAAKKP